MALFDDKVKSQLSQLLSKIKNPIAINFFTQEIECPTCQTTHKFVEEIASLNDKISINVYDFLKDADMAKEFGIDKIPAIVVTDATKSIKGVRFFGIPAGYEINSFIAACVEVSGVTEPLPEAILSRIKKIAKPIHIQVFVTLTCPYCPAAVATAHRLAIENPNITADMIESTTFTPLAVKHNVSSVPKVVINDIYEFVGAQPLNLLLESIEKV
ncbi:MAG: glutaredoxin [Spirochaetes bacterium]|nr:glutaredoxin [Spirochaetota bacterium]